MDDQHIKEVFRRMKYNRNMNKLLEPFNPESLAHIQERRHVITISRHCSHPAGDNIGTTDTTASSQTDSTTSEASSDDDDDDGGGSDEDDHRRPQKRRTGAKRPPVAPSLLRPAQVCQKASIGRTKLWQLENKDPTFPRKIRLGSRTVGWLAADIDAWLAAKVGC